LEKEGLLADEKPPHLKPLKEKYTRPSRANKNYTDLKFKELQAGANPLCMILSVR